MKRTVENMMIDHRACEQRVVQPPAKRRRRKPKVAAPIEPATEPNTPKATDERHDDNPAA